MFLANRKFTENQQNIKWNFDVVQYRVLLLLMLTFVDFF